MATAAAARGRRGPRLLRPSARPPVVLQWRSPDAPWAPRPSRGPARPHATAARAKTASGQSAPDLGQYEQSDRGPGAAARRLTAVAGKIPAPLPPLPSLSSHPPPPPSLASLCGDEEQAPRPPPSLPALGAARLWFASPGHCSPGCGRLPARPAKRRAGPASAHANC